MDDRLHRLQHALDNTSRIVAGVGADQWDAPTPCSRWDVRHLVQHTLGVMANFAAGAAGRGDTVVEPGEYDVGDDPAATCRANAGACIAGWRGRGEFDSPIHLGEDELPGELAFNINLLDAYVHGWDIAQATGQDAGLDPKLCEELLATFRPLVPERPRTGDNFHPVVPVPDDAPAPDRLLAYLGRRP